MLSFFFFLVFFVCVCVCVLGGVEVWWEVSLQAWQLKKQLLWMRRSLTFFLRSNMLEIVDRIGREYKGLRSLRPTRRSCEVAGGLTGMRGAARIWTTREIHQPRDYERLWEEAPRR
jgi:hypothetical protein